MIKEFKYYLNKNLAKKASPDKGEAEALINKAEGRLKFSIKTRELNKNKHRTSLKIFMNA